MKKEVPATATSNVLMMSGVRLDSIDSLNQSSASSIAIPTPALTEAALPRITRSKGLPLNYPDQRVYAMKSEIAKMRRCSPVMTHQKAPNFFQDSHDEERPSCSGYPAPSEDIEMNVEEEEEPVRNRDFCSSPSSPPASMPAPFGSERSLLRNMKSSLSTTSLMSALSQSSPEEPDYLRLILTARVYDAAMQTPLHVAKRLSARLGGAQVWLKREDTQPIFSFKIRGAYNKMIHLSPASRKRGVIAASAGNHAQGVALAAKKLGIRAKIVMPVFTPQIKVDSVRYLGAEVVLHGADFDEAKRECLRLAAADGLELIHPYDDPYVIAGAGTVGMEITRQHPCPEALTAIFVAVGGGGLLSGISFVKLLFPRVKIIGVETVDGDAMTRSLFAGAPVELDTVGLFSDGTAVKRVGDEPFRICKEMVDEMVLVTNDEVCSAIRDIFEDTRGIVEPAGAVALAGLKRWYLHHQQQQQQQQHLDQDVLPEGGRDTLNSMELVAIASGANMNFSRLRFVAERAEFGEETEALVSVTLPERPGTFVQLYNIIHPRIVTEFSYRYSDPDKAHIYVSFRLLSGSSPPTTQSHSPSASLPVSMSPRTHELATLFAEMQQHGMTGTDLCENELAKMHARFLVGGRAAVPRERLLRFAFPDRPGALNHFFKSLPRNVNISLFHYRNFGSDTSRVLVGLQILTPTSETEVEGEMGCDKSPGESSFAAPAEDESHNAEWLREFLDRLGYTYVDETDNPVYRQFLQ